MSVQSAYFSMRQRCENPKDPHYAHYGGRGIRVCEGWRASRRQFEEDMGPRPDGMSLDRRDNDAGYTCGKCEDCVARGAVANCRWVDQTTQMRNTRRAAKVQYRGETMTITELAERTGKDYKALRKRIVGLGWPAEEAVTAHSHARVRRWHEPDEEMHARLARCRGRRD